MRDFQPSDFELQGLEQARSGTCRPKPVHRQRLAYDGSLTHKGVERVDPDEFKRLVVEPDAYPADLAR